MRHGSEFSAAVRKGRRAGRQTLVIHLNRTGSDPASPARVGFVVSKAVGPAVVRNRVKRQLRHITRDRLTALPSGALVVVRANPAAAGSSTLAADFDSALAAALRQSSGGNAGGARKKPDRSTPVSGSPRG
jgi:ribonuclease P protein component